MGENALTEEFLFEAADIQISDFPVDQIKFVGISVQILSDISVILKATNLQIATFRLCGFTTFPEEFFQLKQLRNIDVSGNAIQKLPDPEKFAELPYLRVLNLADNNITDIGEIYKLGGTSPIVQLIITGNICLSANDSFNKIVSAFPKLAILNDLIVTSQHRAYINDLADFSNNSTLPSSKIDDFFFLYVRYLHAASNERYVRRANAEIFCLNRVIRKYSAVEKIQSVWRGYRLRAAYKKMRNAAIFIECITKFWYHKRLKAAIRIRSCYLYYSTRRKIKYIRAVRFFQSLWRRKLSREDAMIEVFASEGVYKLLLYPKDQDTIRAILEPDSISVSPYKIIRTKEPKTAHLPQSPKIFYAIDDSILVRKMTYNKDLKPKCIWCGHDHSKPITKMKISNKGINWAKDCLFSAIKVIPVVSHAKPTKIPKYDYFITYTYNNKEDFTKVIKQLIVDNNGIRLFAEQVVKRSSALLIIQASMRCFLVRSKIFKRMKQEVIENRALNTMRYSIKTAKIHAGISHIASVNRYYNALPHNSYYFVPFVFLKEVMKMYPLFRVHFGYSAERSVILSPNVEGYLAQILPQGKIMFALDDLASLLKIGTTITKAQPSMFTIPINTKWIKRYRIMRITFSNPLEAKNRLALFAWMTKKFDKILTETDTLRYCCANSIIACFRGFSNRKILKHFQEQEGKHFVVAPTQGAEDQVARKPKQEEFVSHQIFIIPKKVVLSPAETIHQLRNDYRPWVTDVDNYKRDKQTSSMFKPNLPPRPVTNLERESSYLTIDKKNLGLSKYEGDNPIKTQAVKVPLARSIPPSPSEYEIEQETVGEFAPFLTGTESPRPRKQTKTPPTNPPVISEAISQQSKKFPASASLFFKDKIKLDDSVVDITKSLRSKALTPIGKKSTLPPEEFTQQMVVEEEKPPLPVEPKEEPAKKELPANSPQKTDNSIQKKNQETFSKLVRLHQIGSDIERMHIIDNTIEMNRQIAREAKEKELEATAVSMSKMRKMVSDVTKRNNIEKKILLQNLEDIKEKSMDEKTKRVQKIKQEHETKRKRIEQDRQFGFAFMSMSRKAMKLIETQHKKDAVSSSHSKAVQFVNEARQQTLEGKMRAASKIKENEQLKIRVAHLERILLDNKRQMRDIEHDDRIREVAELRKKDKERKKLVNEIRSKSNQSYAPKAIINVQEDVLEGAAKRIGQYLGLNPGTVEAHLLCDIISNILE